MRRRGILALLSGAVALGPFWARAQQSMLEIGFLHQGLPEPIPLMAAFSKGLDAAGIGVERDVRIEHRWAEGQYDRLPVLAKELLGRKVAVIAANFLPAALAAKAAPVPFSEVTRSCWLSFGSLAMPSSRKG